MHAMTPRYSREDLANRGEEIYACNIEQHTLPEDQGKFVLIDIESSAYEIDADEMAASSRIFARYPDAQVWMRRVGSPYAYHFGFRRTPASS